MADGLIDFSTSVLPHLEPFAGVAFALNLAYIGLPRFRYRERIQEHVVKKLQDIDGEPHQFGDTDWYKATARLARLNVSGGSSAVENAKLPKESWGSSYTLLFERHRDKAFSIALSFLLGAILALGSAHTAGRFGSVLGFDIMPMFGDGAFNFWFWLIAFAALTPVFFVYRGNYVVRGACQYADTQINDMKKAKQAYIATLPPPPLKTPTKPKSTKAKPSK